MTTIKMNKVNNIYDLLDLLKGRTTMYFGDKKISTLKAFLDGYQMSIYVHKISTKNVFPPFWYFNEWAMQKYNWDESTAGWKNIILEENKFDEEKSLLVFFEMLEEFKTVHPVSIQKGKIAKIHLEFNRSEKCTHKQDGGKPIYAMADEIFLVEYSHDFGFSYFVKNKNKLIGSDWQLRFKDITSANNYIQSLFGSPLDWKFLKGDLKNSINKILE